MKNGQQTQTLATTDLSRLRRGKGLASYEREDIYRLIDDLKMGHVSFIDDDNPVSIPMLCWRVGDDVYLHASQAGRFMKQLQSGRRICISFAKLEAWVLAKSAFHHSANYRSVVLFGVPVSVVNTDDQLVAYSALLEQISPGRWDQVRSPSAKEIAATHLVKLTINEGAYKCRQGGPKDDAADLDLPVWSGIKPIN